MKTVLFLSLITASFSLSLNAASENNTATFEKAFQKAGKKLDEATVKGKELTQKAKTEFKEIKEQTKDERRTWGDRFASAWQEFKSGSSRAWDKLRGQKPADDTKKTDDGWSN